jgi:hypothetical protein
MRTPFARAFAGWLAIVGGEIANGAIRTLFIAPFTGDFTARQISTFTGSALIVAITWRLIAWIRPATTGQAVAIGAMWLLLMVAFELGIGRAVAGFSWERLASDYDLPRGGLLPIGLAVLTLAPLVTARMRRVFRRHG